MSSQTLQTDKSFSPYTRSIQPKTAAYARLSDRVVALVLVFAAGIAVALTSDLVLGISTETVTYGVIILVLLLLAILPFISQLFEWKRTVTRQGVRQERQVTMLSVAYAEYARRLSQLEAERLFLIRQSDSLLLRSLMNERWASQSRGNESKAPIASLETVTTAERVRREMFQGSKARGTT